MRNPCIEIEGVSQQFGTVEALRGVSLCVGQGEMFGLIGHNGAGKSTLFKLMLGLLKADSGSIRVNGVDTGSGEFRAVRRRIGYLPESFVTYDNLSGLEVLQLFADLKRVPRGACIDALVRVGLAQAAGRRVHGYSKGMRQRLGFAQALLGEPDLIFLDEPTNGLDPEGIAHFYAILREVRERGATVVITSHILAEIQERVDRLLILHSGQVAAQGTLERLRAQMALPSTIIATVRPGQRASLDAALAPLGTLDVLVDGARLAVSCQRGDKINVLAALAGLVSDIEMREPSLEDLFLGYGGAHVATH
jgi:Cu-processing system ATP-binding protein